AGRDPLDRRQRLHARRHQLLLHVRRVGRAHVPGDGDRQALPPGRRLGCADARAPRGGARTRRRGSHSPGAADLLGGGPMSTTAKMRAWQLPAGCTSIDQATLVELPRPEAAAGEVLVRVRATSLNFRDQAIARGVYFGRAIPVAGVPLSDGAGVVEALGAGVRTLKIGDRVAGTFFQGSQDVPP